MQESPHRPDQVNRLFLGDAHVEQDTRNQIDRLGNSVVPLVVFIGTGRGKERLE